MSQVRGQVSGVTCRVSHVCVIFFSFLMKLLVFSVQGLLSIGPTQSCFKGSNSLNSNRVIGVFKSRRREEEKTVAIVMSGDLTAASASV